MKKRMAWWRISVFDYSWNALKYYFGGFFIFIFGLNAGLKHWTYLYTGQLTLIHTVAPISVILFVILILKYRKIAKLEYKENRLGY